MTRQNLLRLATDKALLDRAEALISEAVEVLEQAREREIPCNCAWCNAAPANLRHVVTVPNVPGRVAAIGEARKLLEFVGKITGELPQPTILGFLQQLGARSEAEAKRGVQLLRSGEQVSHEAAFDKALRVMDSMLKAHPEWLERARLVLERGQSYAEVVDAEEEVRFTEGAGTQSAG